MAEPRIIDDIELEFFRRAIIHRGIFLLNPENAIAFIRRCHDQNMKLFGINAFLLREKGKIQPFMEHSVDYSIGRHTAELSDAGYWSAAIEHIQKLAETDFFFEISYDATTGSTSCH